jgi:hypothetical protein
LVASAPPGGALLDIAMSGVVAATMDTRTTGGTAAAERYVPTRRNADGGGDGWVVDTATGTVPVAEPRRRHVPVKAADLGEHTALVRSELGLG